MERPDRFDPLKHYRLTWTAPEGEWVTMDRKRKIDFRIQTKDTPPQSDSNNHGNNNNQSKEQLIFELRCDAPDGFQRIDALLENAVEWYKEKLISQRDHNRYLYTMNVQERWSVS